MSDATVASLPPARPGRVALYAAAAVFAAFDLVVLWQGLHPQVSTLYRGYYIDRTTTCLNQPGSGAYVLGRYVSFRSGDEAAARPLMVCGWEGPVGNGIHSVGESSRLHFAVPPDLATSFSVMLEMQAAGPAPDTGTPVIVEVNGREMARTVARKDAPHKITFTVPAAVAGPGGALDLELKFPEAVLTNPQDPNTRKRAIMLTAGQVTPLKSPA